MSTFNITVTSDAVCPWCFIGLLHLEKAIGIFQKTYSSTSRFNLLFAPYQLHPDYPLGKSETLRERLDAKLEGQMAHFPSFVGQLERVGRGVGVEFGWEGRLGDTSLYHDIVEWAGRWDHREDAQLDPLDGDRDSRGDGGAAGQTKKWDASLQYQVVMALFRAFFTGPGIDITRQGHLFQEVIQMIDAHGADIIALQRHLHSGLGREEVRRKAAEARERGIKGVPHFQVTVDGREGVWEVSGAQEVGEWMELLVGIIEGGEQGGRGEGKLCRVVDGKMTCE